jgi:hypothetical protein
MTKDEALRLALEALKNAYWPTDSDLLPAHNIKECAEAITAIKAALEAKYEPENTLHWHALNYRTASVQNAHAMFEALENFVAQRTWVGLTRDEILEARWHNKSSYKFARVLEAKLKEKNNG